MAADAPPDQKICRQNALHGICGLIEAVQKIKSYDTDRLFLAYAVKCIKNKFCTLYKEHCAEVPTESDTEILLEKNSNAYTEEGYRDIVLAIDLNAFIRGINSGKKQKIAILFLVFQKSDSEIASMLGVSRQYVNRVRRAADRACLFLLVTFQVVCAAAFRRR